ncbi:hypothetical protein LZ30DRAFT_312015 [Colletotrichum cereale]|nr:hypothetical protein LZ30DRAFT_312015 [Colletotrichum cereale]
MSSEMRMLGWWSSEGPRGRSEVCSSVEETLGFEYFDVKLSQEILPLRRAKTQAMCFLPVPFCNLITTPVVKRDCHPTEMPSPDPPPKVSWNVVVASALTLVIFIPCLSIVSFPVAEWIKQRDRRSALCSSIQQGWDWQTLHKKGIWDERLVERCKVYLVQQLKIRRRGMLVVQLGMGMRLPRQQVITAGDESCEDEIQTQMLRQRSRHLRS